MTEYRPYEIYCKKPASMVEKSWKAGFPSGNGKVGISVNGYIKTEEVLVNHAALWHWGIAAPVPDVSDKFEETRAAIREGDYSGADWILAKALKDRGYQAELYYPCPVGTVRFDLLRGMNFREYVRKVNMENGEITVQWESDGTVFQRKAFVSRCDDVIVFSLKASQKKWNLNIALDFWDAGDMSAIEMREESEILQNCDADSLFYSVKDGQKRQFGMVGKLLKCDGICEIEKEKIHIKDASDIIFSVKVYGDMDEVKTAGQAKKILENIPSDYYKLLEKHESIHKSLFHRASLQLGNDKKTLSNEEWIMKFYQEGVSPEFVQLYWNYGRYLFISGTMPDGLPFNMYGLWGGEYRLPWSHNMANINIQMMYWHCIVGGYSEYLKTFVNYYCSLLKDFKENAKQIFGLDGIFVPAGTTPGYGKMNQIVPVIVNWIGGAGWISQHMFAYYEVTKDEQMLKEKILPFMEAAALFYEEYLQKENGIYQIYPSVSPENTPGNLNGKNFYHMSHANPTAKNATMDIAIIKELMQNLISLYEKIDENYNKINIWKDILENLPEIKLNESGAVKEWQESSLTDFYYHRHISHLYSLFPGKEIRPGDERLNAYKKALELRIIDGQTGWSLAQMANTYARLCDGEQAVAHLEMLFKACLTESFFTLHNDWKSMGMTLNLVNSDREDRCPMQLDAALGAVNAIQEMIMGYADNYVYILPALPESWNTGKAEAFCFPGGKVDIVWDMDKSYVKITVSADREIEYYLLCSAIKKEGEKKKVNLKAGEKVVVEFGNKI